MPADTAVSRPPVSVVVVTYSPGQSLDDFLDTLSEASSATGIEIVLADNGSTDGSVERAATRPGVRLLRTGWNLGYGCAANLGVQASSAEFVLVANPDIQWRPGALDQLLEAAKRLPEGGAFGPLILTSQGAVYPSARALPSLLNGIGHALVGWWWASNPWTQAYRAENEELCEREAGWLSGSCLLLRREAFEAVKGFDPAYFMYFEDLDLGDRLVRAGWKNMYVPSAVVSHTRAHATSQHAARMAAEHHRSAWLYLSRRYSGIRWLPLRIALRVGLATRSMFARAVPRIAAGAGAQRQWLGDDEAGTGDGAAL